MECVLVSCAMLAAPTPSDALLARALEARGIAARHVAWDALDPAESAGRALCLRSTWDYHRRADAFLSWLDACEAAGARVENAPSLVRWNADKGYLREFAARGIALPDSAWFAPGERPDLARLAAERGWREFVIKPRTSATAHGTHRLAAGATLADTDWAPILASGALVQEFLEEITTGELSLLYAGGAYSHAVRKVPAPGDYRVQNDFGGRVTAVEPSAAARALADATLAAAPAPTTYARVDIVETARGPRSMELELIEPELFLHVVPPAAARFADAVAAAFTHRSLVP
ncbi:MAG: hypothetical protein HY275_15490 [Gemmatimonadetes bacterium]|nr:hypothetical protein [Gemmatimonadota bacterium]